MKAAKQLGFDDKPHRRPFALFSGCTTHWSSCEEQACVGRPYRYVLSWPTGVDNNRVCMFALANPSTASAEQTDATVARCIAYAKRWGFGWCEVVNARAWRATDPKAVPADPEAVGPRNDDIVLSSAESAELVVCGWGKLAGERGPVMLDLIRNAGKVPHALKLNADLSPAHPLYLRADLEPFPMP